MIRRCLFFFFQAEDGIRDIGVTGVQTCALPICALVLQALAGHDPRDPASASRPIPDYTAQLGNGIRGLKIGVIHHFHETDHKVSEGTQRGITAAIATFRGLGAEIREVQLSPLQDWNACGSLISIAERAAAYEEWSRTRLGDFGERLR